LEAPVELDIRRDPVSDALEGGCLLVGPEHQLLGDFYWLDWCKAVSGLDNLFVFRHRGTGRFEVGVWAFSPRQVQVGVFQELEGFSAPPHVGMWPSDLLVPSVMQARLKPMDAELERLRKRVIEKKRDEERLREENMREKRIAAQRLKGAGMEKEAHDVLSGAVPFTGRARAGGDRIDMWVEELKRMRDS